MRHAGAAGFPLVELHDDWADPALQGALAETGLGVASLNTAHHGPAFGIACDPRAAARARADIEAAAVAAEGLGAAAIHVLAGKGDGQAARRAFEAALGHALAVWPRAVLVEPLSPGAVPGYHVASLGVALDVIERLAHPRLGILFDTFHIGMTEPSLEAAFARAAPHVGHIQVAALPTRAEPDTGAADILAFLETVAASGYRGAVGAEFTPATGVPRLDWLAPWARRLAAMGA